MENKISIKKILFNPFEYIAGTKALIIGILILLASSVLDFYSERTLPMGMSVNLTKYLSINLGSFVIFSVLLFIVGLIFSTSKVRFIDVIGTQALARYPGIIASLISFIPAYNRFLTHTYSKIMQKACVIDLSTFEIVSSLILYLCTLLMGIWTMILMFNAFKVATNLKGERGVLIFVITWIVWLVTVLGIRMFVLSNLFH
ncbi:MAG: hypothetical protein JXB49_17680 [Bacteroidales bacterium]|nr:hypothetical protein [Bacteroidales bacterium]